MKRLINHAQNAHSHLTKHHKKYIIWWFWLYGLAKTFVFMFSLLASFAYFGQHATTLAAWTSNNDFIEQNFWDMAPSSWDLISALYGTWIWDTTAYTDHRSGYDWSCSLSSGNMNIEYIVPWTGTIPENLMGNTIYVLNSWDYLIPYASGINMSGCNTIIWSWDVYMYSTWEISDGWMISNSNNQYWIVDNVDIDWSNTATGSPHPKNKYGIYLIESNNNAFNNISIFSNTYYWFYIEGGSYNLLNYTYIYNNGNWVRIQWQDWEDATSSHNWNKWMDANNNIINNSKIYNNASNGLFYGCWLGGACSSNHNGWDAWNSFYNILTNTQIYNNINWISFVRASRSSNVICRNHTYGDDGVNSWSVLDNSLIYNNTNWIWMIRWDYIILNNLDIYNNNNWLTFSSNSVWSIYYGKLWLFDNDNSLVWTIGSDIRLTWWKLNDTLVSWLSRDSGYIDYKGCMMCDFYTNPRNNLWQFLMDTWSYSNCTKRWPIVWTGTGDMEYLYWSSISKQSTGVKYNFSNNLENSNLFYDPTKFLAEINSLWSISIWYITTWDNSNFITWAFWQTDPSDCEIISALYGTWIWDITAYTDHRSGYDYSCSIGTGNMNVEHVLPWTGTIPENLTENTIYVLNSWDYLIPYSGGVNMSGCNAIVWNGNVYIYSTWVLDIAFWMIGNNSNEYWIIDNIDIDGEQWHSLSWKNYYWVFFNSWANNWTINNISTYNNAENWIYFKDSSYFKIIDSDIYNNSENWIYVFQSSWQLIDNVSVYNNSKWILVRQSNSSIVDNSRVYNNRWYGIRLDHLDKWVLNNTQVYNNMYWVYFGDISGWVINNVDTYNNMYWLYLWYSMNTTIYDIKIYNNNFWIYNWASTGWQYYWELNMFDNTTMFVWTSWDDQYLTKWLAIDTWIQNLWRSTWTINTWWCMSCDRYTNPKNNLWIFLMDTGTYLWCTRRWIITWTWTSNTNYLYWNKISKQKTWVEYSWTDLIYSSLFYDPTKFIAETNSLWIYTWAYMCNAASCIFDWVVVNHLDSAIAYENSSVACRWSCLSETITCNNWILNWTYRNGTCSIATCWGNGSNTLSKDDCPGGDNSPSYYDKTCGWHGSAHYDLCGVDASNHTTEQKWAYIYTYKIWSTTMCPIQTADLWWHLRRSHLAKMISEFAVKIMWKEPLIWREWCNKFNDISDNTKELKNYMKLSCELWLMWFNSDGKTVKTFFNPHWYVTRAEFGTVFSRLLYGDKYNADQNENNTSKWYRYEKHLQALKDNHVMMKIDWAWAYSFEKRGYVMIMLQRADIDEKISVK